MFPSCTSQDIVNRLRIHFEPSGNSYSSEAGIVQFVDFNNICFIQPGIVVPGPIYHLLPKNPKGMQFVFARRDRLKIFNAVICLISVFMIYLTSRRNRANKRSVNKPVNRKYVPCFSECQHDAMIAVRYQVRRSLFLWLDSPSIGMWCHAPNVSKIANFVNPLIGWYGFPSFHKEIIA